MKWNCLGYLFGLCSLHWLQNEQQVVGLSMCLIVALISLLFFPKKKYPRLLKIKQLLLPVLLGLSLSTFSALNWINYSAPVISAPGKYELSGHICSIPQKRPDSREPLKATSVSFSFCITQINQTALSFNQANKIKLTRYRVTETELEGIKAGIAWTLIAKLKPVHSRKNPAGFDYEMWSISEGIIATGYVRRFVSIQEESSFKQKYHAVRQRIYSRLIDVIPEGPSKGVILALSVGERADISELQWQSIKESGTAHLLAISGLHIGIAALWGYTLFWFIFAKIPFLTRRVPAQKLAEVMSLVAAASIALISGFGYPAQRALVMLIIYFACRWSNRQFSLGNLLALSVIVITLIQPFAVLSISFWLSVIAVSVISLIQSYQQEIKGRFVKTKEWLRLNWYLYLGLIPISWFAFDNISVVGFIANILLIPLTSFVTTPVVYLGLAALMISDSIAQLCFSIAGLFVSLTLSIQSYLGNINQLLNPPQISLTSFILMLFAAILILLPSKLPPRALVIAILIIIGLKFAKEPEPANFKMVIFDIGQGLAIHINVGGQHLLFDTGYGNSQYSMYATTIAPYLNKIGVREIDKLVISHSDADHAGGIEALLANIKVKQILSGEENLFERLVFSEIEATDDKNSKLERLDCHGFNPWKWGDVEFEFVRHLSSQQRSGNNASCVLLIKTAWQSILIPGDIEKSAELKLLANGLGPVDILVAPHHGSETSSTRKFVERVTPKVVVFSAGYANQWAFPRERVVQRYLNRGSKILTTYEQGAISVHLDEFGELKITSERSKLTNFWQLHSQ